MNCEKTSKLRLEDITVVDPKLLIFRGRSTVANHDWERRASKKMSDAKLKDPQILSEKYENFESL